MPARALASLAIAASIPLLAACDAPADDGPKVTSKCLGATYPSSTELTILGNHQGKRVMVKGGWFTKPQVIMVSGFQRMTWDFSQFPADKLRGVIASGKERPEIVGVPDGVPVRTVMETDEPGDCGNGFMVYRGSPALDEFVPRAEKMTGLKVTRFRGAYHATEFDADANGAQEGFIDPMHDMHQQNPPIPPELAPLVAQGLMRPATQADVDAYNAAVTGQLKTGYLASYAADELRAWKSFVVLQKVDIPPASRLSRRFFIVPPGVVRPSGQEEYDGTYFIETGKCAVVWGDCPGSSGWQIALHGKPAKARKPAPSYDQWSEDAEERASPDYSETNRNQNETSPDESSFEQSGSMIRE